MRDPGGSGRAWDVAYLRRPVGGRRRAKSVGSRIAIDDVDLRTGPEKPGARRDRRLLRPRATV